MEGMSVWLENQNVMNVPLPLFVGIMRKTKTK
jgi:hypothetical protein